MKGISLSKSELFGLFFMVACSVIGVVIAMAMGVKLFGSGLLGLFVGGCVNSMFSDIRSGDFGSAAGALIGAVVSGVFALVNSSGFKGDEHALQPIAITVIFGFMLFGCVAGGEWGGVVDDLRKEKMWTAVGKLVGGVIGIIIATMWVLTVTVNTDPSIGAVISISPSLKILAGVILGSFGMFFVGFLGEMKGESKDDAPEALDN